MIGFERWKYPYSHDVIAEGKRGTVLGFHKQTVSEKDETPYEVDGVCGSCFEYAGD
jgi:hypothetical protein